MSILLIIIGGLLTWLSFWLMLHLSDKKILRYFRPRQNIARMSKSEVEAYRAATAALFAMMLMVMGALMLLAGVVRLLGFSYD